MLLGKEYHWLAVRECLDLNYLYAIGSGMSLPAQFVKQKHVITDAWVWADISLSARRQRQNLSRELVVWRCYTQRAPLLWVCGWAWESQIHPSHHPASPCYNKHYHLWVKQHFQVSLWQKEPNKKLDLGYATGLAVIEYISSEMPTLSLYFSCA